MYDKHNLFQILIVCRLEHIKLRQYWFLSNECVFNANLYRNREPVIINDILLKMLSKSFFGSIKVRTRSILIQNVGKLIGMVHILNAIEWRTHLRHS